MKNTNFLARHFAALTQAQAGQRMQQRNRRNRISNSRPVVKQACRLLLCLMLICQGFIFDRGGSAVAQTARRATPAPAVQTPSSVSKGLQQRGRSLRAETPQISNGALIDEAIQRNPEMFTRDWQAKKSASGRKTAVSSGDAPLGTPNLVVEEPNPLAPALGNTFDAYNFNDNPTLSGFFNIPPDPAGAAGPTHVVNVVNTGIEWYTKTGTRQNRQRLGRNSGGSITGSFFEPLNPANGTFDPKVIYDQYAGRFIVITMERVEASGPTPNSSRVLVAVSDDSDPNGTWFFTPLITEETIGGFQTWADFPGLAVDSEAIYFTNNQFRHNNQTSPGVFAGQRTWIIAKDPFYTGGVAVATRFDTAAVANANPAGNDGGAVATTMQPTQMYGDTPGGVGTYLLTYSGLNDGVNLYIQVIRIDSPLSSPTFTARFSIWGTAAANDAITLALASAPQAGTTRLIQTNDRRFSQNGVFRNGLIYCAAPIRPPAASPTDAGQTTVHYFIIDPVVIDTTLADPPPTDQGNVGGEDIAPGTFTFFPSVAVDTAGDMAIGFAASAPTIFPGAYFTGRLAADAPGTVRPAGGLRAGRDFYVRTFTSATGASRWGDYTGLWLDPSDETTFWAFNEFALPRGTTGIGSQTAEDGRWGTAWGSFSLAAQAATPAGAVIISEFRLRGPAGAEDEFIELYNNTDAAISVNDVNPPASGPSGWAIVTSDAPTVAKAIVPTGTTIPARGHYLVANNTATTGYSLGLYPAGNNGINTLPTSTTATPDRTYTTNIPDNVGMSLFRSANSTNWLTTTDRLDAAGPSSEANVVYKEGTGYPPLNTTPPVSNYSFYRNLENSTPRDTDNNSADFVFVDTEGLNFNAGQRLGAPGPENLSSPIQRNTIGLTLLDPGVSSSSSPNRARAFCPGAEECNPIRSNSGTLTIRRTVTNNTGAGITRLRFRIVNMTTFPSSGDLADLRALTSTGPVVIAITGTNPACPANSCTVQATTLETPPTQVAGGGLNSTLSAGTITLAAPLANGASINVQFLLGVQQAGRFRFLINIEALP